MKKSKIGLNLKMNGCKLSKSKLTKHEGMLLKFIKDIWGSLTLINERLDKIEEKLRQILPDDKDV